MDRKKSEGLLCLFFLYFVWGTTFLAIRIAMKEPDRFGPYSLAALRVLIAGGLSLGVGFLRGNSFKLPAEILWQLALTGLLLWIGGHALVIWGIQTVDSSIAALLFGAMPLWTVLIEVTLGRRRLSQGIFFSCILGVFGMALLVWPEKSISSNYKFFPMLALVLSPGFWALGSLLQSKALGKYSAWVSAGYQQVFGGLGCFSIAIFNGEALNLVSSRVIFALGYLTIFGALLASAAYVRALQLLPASSVMTFALVNPIVAVVLGIFVLNEPFTPTGILGMIFILMGVIGLFRYGEKA